MTLYIWISSDFFRTKWQHKQTRCNPSSWNWILFYRILLFFSVTFLFWTIFIYSVWQDVFTFERNAHYEIFPVLKTNIIPANNCTIVDPLNVKNCTRDFNYIVLANITFANNTDIGVNIKNRTQLEEKCKFEVASLLQNGAVESPISWARSFLNKIRSKSIELQRKNNNRNFVRVTKPVISRTEIWDLKSYETRRKQRLRWCRHLPEQLVGRIKVSPNSTYSITENDILTVSKPLKHGGEWYPDACISRHRVAIIIPYRNRKEHLMRLLYHLHPLLQRQQLHYRIFVVEQDGNAEFNKGALMNAAFYTVLERMLSHDGRPYHCFIFHDVDMIPEDDRNLYSCTHWPHHLSVSLNEMNYTLPYPNLIGGVFKISLHHFLKVNGYSNMFWGWGCEDDDMAYRLRKARLRILRPPWTIGRYTMMYHTKRIPSPRTYRNTLLSTAMDRFRLDGLNSMKHRLINITYSSIHSLILVDVGPFPNALRKLFKNCMDGII